MTSLPSSLCEETAAAAQGVLEIPKILKDVVISRVKPNSDYEHPTVMYPSFFDMYGIIDVYIPNFFLYRLDSNDPSAFQNFVCAIKSSLSKVMSIHAPIAGKWVWAEDAWTRKLQMCDGEASGAVFVEATVEDDMAKFMDGHNFVHPDYFMGQFAVQGFSSNSQTVYKRSTNKEWPSLIIQVTSFKCGGAALVVNFNHMTMDAVGFNIFLKAWVEIAATGETTMGTASCDRSRLLSPIEMAPAMGFSAGEKNVDDQLADIFRSLASDTHRVIDKKNFYVKRETMESLKRKARESANTDDPSDSEQLQRLSAAQNFSRFDCLTAALWRCLSRVPGSVEGTSSEDDLTLLFPVEGRKRWNDPPLPEDYIGNVFILLPLPAIPGSELSKRSFSFAAGKVHEVVASVTPQTAIESVECNLELARQLRSSKQQGLASVPKVEPGMQPKKGSHTVCLSSWLTIDNIHNLDFGAGKPFFASPGFTGSEIMAVIFVIPPPPNTEYAAGLHFHIDVKVMKVLLADPEFQTLVS